MSGKTIALGALLALALLAGFIEGSFATTDVAASLSAGHLAITVALIFVWFYLDARERKYQSGIALKLLMLGLTVFALPYYLFRSRGAKGGFKALGFAVLLFIAAMILYRLGAWVSA